MKYKKASCFIKKPLNQATFVEQPLSCWNVCKVVVSPDTDIEFIEAFDYIRNDVDYSK